MAEISSVAPPVSITSPSAISGQSGSCSTMSGELSCGGAPPKTVTSLANDIRRGLVSSREDVPPGKHSSGTWPGEAPDAAMEMRSCVSWAMAINFNPAHKRQQSRKHSPSQCRMRKGVLVDPVLAHQATSGLVKQLRIHRDARNVRTKGRLPHVPGHCPWREQLRYVLDSDILRSPVLFMQMSQAVTDGALPNSAPFVRAPPQLSQLQMGI